jgi:dihydropteroate synthase
MSGMSGKHQQVYIRMSYKIRKLEIKTRKQGLDEFNRIGATIQGQRIMANKIFPLILKVKDINPRAAEILKQEMLSRMGDVVTSRDSLVLKDGSTDVIILGTGKSIKSLIEKLKIQPFGLKKLAEEISGYLDLISKSKSKRTISISDRIFDLDNEGALIMGILNITPDSFHDGGKYFSKKEAIEHAEMMIKEGAHIIDVGGMSTRPGSKPITVGEEIERVIPAIRHIAKKQDVMISIDTCRSEVAKKAIESGADIINDISGMAFDGGMVKLAAESGSSVVIMHMQGTPENMQENPTYDDVVDEIYSFLYERASKSIEAGISNEKIIIDPGIGFGKKPEHNLEILARLADFTNMGFPVLVGTSRKSFIGNLLGDVPTEERLEGSIASAVHAYLSGAGILRVHDVSQTVKAIKIVKSIGDYV